MGQSYNRERPENGGDQSLKIIGDRCANAKLLELKFIP